MVLDPLNPSALSANLQEPLESGQRMARMWASQEEMPELSHQGARAWPTTDWGHSHVWQGPPPTLVPTHTLNLGEKNEEPRGAWELTSHGRYPDGHQAGRRGGHRGCGIDPKANTYPREAHRLGDPPCHCIFIKPPSLGSPLRNCCEKAAETCTSPPYSLLNPLPLLTKHRIPNLLKEGNHPSTCKVGP